MEERQGKVGTVACQGLDANIMLVSTLMSHLPLYVTLRFTLGGMSYNKLN